MPKIRVPIPSPLKVFARRFGLAAALVVAGILGGLGYGTFKTPTYTATAFVLVVGQPDEGLAAVNYAQAYARLAPLPETLAWSSRGMPQAERERARRSLQASSSPDTPLVRLTGTANDPARAATYANTAADALVRYGVAHQQDTGVRVTLMTEADAPLTASSPNPPMNLAVGTATGLLLGALVAATGIASRLRKLRELSQTQAQNQPQAQTQLEAQTQLQAQVPAQADAAPASAQVPPQGPPPDEPRQPVHAEAGK